MSPRALAVGAVAFALAAAGLPGWPAAGSLIQENFNTLYYADWPGDADGNRLDDRLDAEIAGGATGVAHVFVHYALHPGPGEDGVLHAAGAEATWVMANWDDILARAPYENLPAITGLAQVVMVEQHLPEEFLLDASARSIRARAAPGVVEDGFDHRLAVHETLGFRGEGMVIALIDTGVDGTHDSLDDLDDDPATADPKLLQRVVGGVTIHAGFDALLDAPASCIDPVPSDPHGTAVAGIALGTGGPTGVQRGVAPAARYVEINVFSEVAPNYNTHAVPIALDVLLSFNLGATCYGPPGDDRVDVASMSISTTADPQAMVNRMIDDVVRSGITFVQAAGNSGPGAATLRAGADGAILVGNAQVHDTVGRADDEVARSSSRGPRPGDGDTDALDELRPDVAAPGRDILAPAMGTGSGHAVVHGTSFAAPHVAGLAALVLQAAPGLRPVATLTHEQTGDPGAVPVRDLLQQTAQAKTAAQEQPPQVSQAGRWDHPWNNAWGYGLVDGYGAVQRALG